MQNPLAQPRPVAARWLLALLLLMTAGACAGVRSDEGLPGLRGDVAVAADTSAEWRARADAALAAGDLRRARGAYWNAMMLSDDPQEQGECADVIQQIDRQLSATSQRYRDRVRQYRDRASRHRLSGDDEGARAAALLADEYRRDRPALVDARQ